MNTLKYRRWMPWTMSFGEKGVCIKKNRHTLVCLTSVYSSFMKDVFRRELLWEDSQTSTWGSQDFTNRRLMASRYGGLASSQRSLL
jgi:hypothetical protein